MKSKKSKRAKYARAAAKCHNAGIRDAVASKWTAKKQRRHEVRKLGTFGAASPVRRIDPVTGEVIQNEEQPG